MCGIFGWYCWGQERPETDLLPRLFLANEKRGRDAAGFAFRGPTGIVVLKNPGTPESFVQSLGPKGWQDAAQSPIVIGHVRAQTKGTAENNNNNHPVYLKNWVVVHNGQVHNDDDLFSKLGRPRFAEVDTAAIPLVLESGMSEQDSLARLGLLGGSATLAAWNSNAVDTLYLARLGFNDVYLFYDESRHMLVFSSVPEAKRLLTSFNLGGLGLATGAVLPDGTVLVLRPNQADCKWLGLKQSPFYSPRAKAAAAPSWFSKKDQGAEKFRWVNTNSASAFRKLRPPDFHECRPISFDNYDPAIASAQSRKTTGLTIPTPYGRWVFTKDPEYPDFVFHPHKSVKRFHEINKLPEWWKTHENLEAVKACDGLLSWEDIRIAETTGDCTSIVPGFVCPWCGVMYPAQTTRHNLWTCEWCLITSKPPVLAEAIARTST